MARLEGKVAQILSDTELVIALGSKDGVTPGLKFAVLAPTPIEIKHPDTGEVLGVIDREKVRVRVEQVMDRLSICATFETYSAGGGLGVASFAHLLGPERVERQTFAAPEGDYPAPLTKEEQYIKIGDRVKQVSP